MKKIYIILFIIIFSIGFQVGDYDSDGKYKNLPKKIKYFFNDLSPIFFPNSKKKIPEEKVKEFDNIEIIKANSFGLKVENFLTIKDFKINTETNRSISKTAAFQMDKINGEIIYKIFLQNGLTVDDKKIIEKINLSKSEFFGSSGYKDFSGGVKKVFTIDGNEYALISNKKDECFYASLINLLSLKEILKSECLPVDESNFPDFNGIGGAVTTFNQDIYLAIGAPESGSQNIRELAQSEESILGKILKISRKNLLKSDQKNLEYSIYTKGHRNPQGIVEINSKIFSNEHGPQGGDELNQIIGGGNYGWPLKSYGTRYMDGKPFKYSKKIDNYQEPIYSFLPAIGPSSLSNCPKNLDDYYSENICLMLLTLKERSVFIILLDDDSLMIQSMEQIKLKKRLRHFAVDKNIKTFFDEDSFYVSTDSGKDLNILKLSFLNFR